MKNVLVLGGAGFIGSSLIVRLAKMEYKVTAVDRYWPCKMDGVDCVTGDVFDNSLLSEVMRGQDVVYHLVSTTIPATSNRSPSFDCETNVLGSIRILDAMVECNVPRIVFSSSGGTVYGIPDSNPIRENAANYPISAYGIGKLAIEKYLYLYSRLHGINATVLRISNPFGCGQDPEKGQGVISAFVYKAFKEDVIEVWGDGSVVRDFIYIDDVIDALVSLDRFPDGYSLMNIGSGEGRSILQVLAEIQKYFDHPLRVDYKPARSCDVPEIVLDISNAISLLGWKPRYSFEEGVSELVAKMRKQLAFQGRMKNEESEETE